MIYMYVYVYVYMYMYMYMYSVYVLRAYYLLTFPLHIVVVVSR